MVIDFRVRAPFEAYRGSNLFSNLQMLEEQSIIRADALVADSAKQFSMELLLKEADEAGIDKLVVPLRKAINGKNEDLATLIHSFSPRIIGLIGVEVLDIGKAINEIEKFIVNGPCKGIVLEPGQDKTPWLVNSSWVYPLYDYCQEKEIPIAITYGGIMTPSLRYYAPEAIDDVAAAFPKLNIALAHGGWPYVTEVCQIALNRHNVYIAPDFYMIRSPGMHDYIMAANYLLPHRIMFASGYPIISLQGAKKAYEESGLNQNVIHNVMGGNTAEFLKI